MTGKSQPTSRRVLARRDRLGTADGMSLVEMLVIVVVLGILTAVVVFAVGGSNDANKITACVKERDEMIEALMDFKELTGRYPENVVEMVEGTDGADAPVLRALPTYWTLDGSTIVRMAEDELPLAVCGPDTKT